MTKEKTDHISKAQAMLANMTDQDRELFLASLGQSELTEAIRKKKDMDKEKADQDRKAISDAMSKIGPILDKAQIKGSVKFSRDEKQGWTFQIIQSRSSNGSKARSPKKPKMILDDTLRAIIDKALKEKKPPRAIKPNSEGISPAFEIDGQEIPTTLIASRIKELTFQESEAQKQFPWIGRNQFAGAYYRYDMNVESGKIIPVK